MWGCARVQLLVGRPRRVSWIASVRIRRASCWCWNLAGIASGSIVARQSPEGPQPLTNPLFHSQTPQPWHASSTLVHEAVLGVSKVAAEASATKSYAETGVVRATQQFFFKLIDGQKVGTILRDS